MSRNSTELSETDRNFLELAITCLKSPPEIDILKMADKMKIKPKSVMNRWCEIRKKLFADAPEGDALAAELTPKPKNKRKATDVGDPGTPTKTPRRTKKQTPKSTKVKEEDFDMDAEMSGDFEDDGI